MKPTKIILLSIVFNYLMYSSVFAQEPIVLETELPKTSSFIFKTTVIDNRIEQSDFGFIQKGAFNKYTPVFFQNGIEKDLENFLNKKILDSINPSLINEELIIRLNFFRIAEQTGGMSEKGFFKYNADYFLKSNNGYVLLKQIDTLFQVRAMDVTNKLLRKIGDNLFLLNQSISKENLIGKQSYSLSNIIKFDSIQKKTIPIYNTTKYNDGFFNSWNSLKMNKPTSSSSITYDEKKSRFYYLKKNGKIDFIVEAEDSIYAICYKGKIYVSNGENFFPAEFKNNNFFITAKGDKRVNQGGAFAAQMMFGIIGRAIYESSSPNIWYLYRINYRNGELLTEKEVTYIENK
ncbi:MAG: hypothetical protein RJA07_1237 [Bacteroidota bacterium]|jgi:hypothetical protein